MPIDEWLSAIIDSASQMTAFDWLYHSIGWTCALLTLYGAILQVKNFRERKRKIRSGELKGESVTEGVDPVRWLARTFGPYSVCFVAALADPVNWYLIVPRLPRIGIALKVLWDIFVDQKNWVAVVSFFGCLAFIIIPIVIGVVFGLDALRTYDVRPYLVFATICFVLYGSIKQIINIRRFGKLGAMVYKTELFAFLATFSTFVFGWFIEPENGGWLVRIHFGLSTIAAGVTLYHFHWVEFSPLAAERRAKWQF